MQNGFPLGGQQVVPDLAAIRSGQAAQDIPDQVKQMILEAAGISDGEAAVVDTFEDTVRLGDPLPMVLFSPSGIDVLGMTGVDTDGVRQFIPWHAITRIRVAR